MTDTEPSGHDAVKARVSPPPGSGAEIQTLALDALVQRIRSECEVELVQIEAGADPIDELWDYFMALPWEAALPVLEELYELNQAEYYISWDLACSDGVKLYRHAQYAKDYIRLFLLHVVVTRIFPDTEPPNLRLVRSEGT